MWAWKLTWRAHSFILEKRRSGRRWAIPFRRKGISLHGRRTHVFLETCQANPASGWRGSTSEWGCHLPTPPFLAFPPGLCGKVEGTCERETVTKRDEEGKKLTLSPISLLTFAFSVSDHRVPGINIWTAKSTSTQPQFWQPELLLCGLVCLWPPPSAVQVGSSL